VLALRVPAARNVLLYARRDAQPPEPGSPEFAAGLSDAGAVLASRARLAGSWCWIEAGAGPWLSDDRAPLELLERASIARAGRPGTLDRDAVLGAGAPLEQADAGGWEAALGAGDYARALERTLALPIEARLSARAEVFYAARDFEAVLVLADEARRRAPSADPPEDLRFLARAAAAAIWLRRPDAAAERLAELDLAIEDAARAGLEPALAAQWRAQAGEYRASGEELTATAVAVARAQVVGRTTAAIAAALALAAGLFALRGCSRFPCRPGR
jgi:hypothetical protein